MADVQTSRHAKPHSVWGLPSGIARQPADQIQPGSAPKQARRWPLLAAALAWIVYSATAVWMVKGMHYMIGDAMSRTADARFVLYSRDPHLAAIGMVWLPLPVFAQLPFMAVLSPLNQAILSGPLATAFAGALTVLVVAHICRTLVLSNGVSIAFTVVFALNPLIVYTASNGMSEEWSLLGCAIALLGFVRWCRNHRPLDLAVLAAGLSCVMLVRYEGLVLAPVMAAAAAVNDGRVPRGPTLWKAWRVRLGRCVTTFGMVVLPTFYLFGLWLFTQYIIERDPLFWAKAQTRSGHTSPNYVWLPHPLTNLSIVGFGVKMLIVVCPEILVIGPLLIFRRSLSNALVGVGILAGALLWPGLVIIQLLLRSTSGVPRYFVPSVLFVTVAAVWLVADLEVRTRWGGRLVALGMVLLLVSGAVGATAGLDNPTRTAEEQESHFMGSVLGHREVPFGSKAFGGTANAIVPITVWTALARDLDKELARGSKVLVDDSVDFPAVVLSRHPARYIVSSDRDFQPILSNWQGRFAYLVKATSLSNGGGTIAPTLDAILASTDGGHWVLWHSYSTAEVFHWVVA